MVVVRIHDEMLSFLWYLTAISNRLNSGNCELNSWVYDMVQEYYLFPTKKSLTTPLLLSPLLCRLRGRAVTGAAQKAGKEEML